MKFISQPFLVLVTFLFLVLDPVFAAESVPWWRVQAIDTMKYSRDPSRQMLGNPEFDQVIDRQMAAIAGTGVTHVAIATPYDDEFLPMLTQWVAAARKHGLKVWFRGNLSGWEGWFDYPKISRSVHTKKIQEFILYNRRLFADGDIFSSCPECENGGPGDPRQTGDAASYRQFLINEYQVVKKAFATIRVEVTANYYSMNGDVARLIMDRETTKALDGLVVIDHYVKDPEKLARDIEEIAERSGGQVMLGEFGAPIPDIHGSMSASEQAGYINELLVKISGIRELVGVSYWTSVGGSTQLWNESGEARPAVEVITKAYKPALFQVTVKTQRSQPVTGAVVSIRGKEAVTDALGVARVPYKITESQVKVTHDKYGTQTFALAGDMLAMEIILAEKSPGWWGWIWQTFLWWLR